jgi:hypothetical protein
MAYWPVLGLADLQLWSQMDVFCYALLAPRLNTLFVLSKQSSTHILRIQYIVMKAVQFFAQGDLRVVDVPKPEPKENEALVAIEWCGICGSDLHEYEYGKY